MTAAVLEVCDLHKVFGLRTGLLGRRFVHAVNGVDLALRGGETLALVGESGSGKSTLGNILLGLMRPTSGTVLRNGLPLPARRRTIARHVQVVFQDPFASLNPRHRIRDIVRLPLDVHRVGPRRARDAQVADALGRVGLTAAHGASYPRQLSGGQRQRVAIARALILRPEVVILDEPTSALDVSVQSQILNLLLDQQDELGVAYLLITHNIAVVQHMATRTAVMYLGRIVEQRDTEDLFARPAHPYTQALLASVLTPDPALGLPDVELGTSLPNPIAPPPGCTFHPRCPHAMPICRQTVPPNYPIESGFAACHLLAS
jgi:peptide/nickel transport system ATP-binding protein